MRSLLTTNRKPLCMVPVVPSLAMGLTAAKTGNVTNPGIGGQPWINPDTGEPWVNPDTTEPWVNPGE